MDRLAGILLKVQPLDADADVLQLAVAIRIDLHDHLALADDRLVELGDLVALRQVGVEIVLAGEDRALVDLRLQPETGAHGLGDAFLVDHRQHARHRRVDKADMVVRLAAESRRCPGKQF